MKRLQTRGRGVYDVRVCAAGAVAAFLSGIALVSLSVYRSAAACSGAMPFMGAMLLCVLSAFFLAVVVCQIVRGQTLSSLGLVLSIVCGIVVACLSAPLLAAFPPAAAFLCRISFPEEFYWPRPYCRSGAGFRHALLGGVCLGGMGLVDCVVLAQVFWLAGERSTNALVVLGLGVACVAGAIARKVALQRGEIPRAKKTLSMASQALWGCFWIEAAVVAALYFVPQVVIGTSGAVVGVLTWAIVLGFLVWLFLPLLTRGNS